MTKEEFLKNAEACIREYGGNANVEEILLRKFIKESGREKARLYKERMESHNPSYLAPWDFLEKAFLAGAIEAFKYRASVANLSLQEVYDNVRSWLDLPEPDVENIEFINEEK
ncbi:MAG: hypothetical protein IKP45_03110 [Bacteroidales bacterium]|nr:hypothetical protein [Bacteroidales bacterium]